MWIDIPNNQYAQGFKKDFKNNCYIHEGFFFVYVTIFILAMGSAVYGGQKAWLQLTIRQFDGVIVNSLLFICRILPWIVKHIKNIAKIFNKIFKTPFAGIVQAMYL